MIYDTLSEIADNLNQHFKMRFGLPEDKLFLSGLVEADGALAIEKDCVVMSVINIQEEKRVFNKRSSDGNPAVAINLLVLFTTTFSGKMIGEGLKFIAEIISYFQQEKNIDVGGNRVTFEFYNVDLSEQNNLWASIGSKYSPAVVYKIGQIYIDDDMPASDISYASDFPG